MWSTVKKNGDIIKQFELQAVLGADRALNALVLNLHRRIAAGARVQKGRLDIEVEAFSLEKGVNLAETERFTKGPSGTYEGIWIETAKKVAEWEAMTAKNRARKAKEVRR